MEILVARLVAWKAKQRETFLSNSGTYQGTNVTKIADLCSTLKSMVSSHYFCGIFVSLNASFLSVSPFLFISGGNSFLGVIFVHDRSQRRTRSSLQKWAAEIAATGTFSAPLASGGPGGLPIPYIVVGNKADIAPKEGTRVSSGNLVDVAREWAEKQGLLPQSEELPLVESFPSGGGLIAVSLI